MIRHHDPTATELTAADCEFSRTHAECHADVHQPWCYDGTTCDTLDEDGNTSDCACHGR